ncbi:MAG: DUF4105 domain-containing protein [Nitrospinaceae bacterium]
MPDFKRIISTIVVFLLAGSGIVHAQPPTGNPYAESLVQQAMDRELYKHRYWRLLLHYKRHLWGGYESEADGLGFFNVPEGKRDLKAEMAAAIRNFFVDPATLEKEDDHPQCSYPARYKWLKRQLKFDPGRLPELKCELLGSWLDQLNPERITLIFASFYMANPASMFGHTLIRIDGKQNRPGRKLLSYGVNYAANPDTNNALLYAIGGLSGFFKGTFSVFPYFIKVQEYNNWESRDLWEYELNLTPDQINNLLLHLWELGGTYFDYFYFTENCSFHMLTILEVANPDLRLTDNFFISVQPADTIKVLTKQEGLIGKITYRPAILHQMKDKTEQMTSDEKDILYGLVEDKAALKRKAYQNLKTPRKALVLDAYLDYLQYLGMQRENVDPEKPLRIPHSVLLERSKLKFKRNDGEPTRFSTRPELGHGTDRLRLGFGVNDDEVFQEIAYRPTLHDLMARDAGYGKNSQFLFLDFVGRYFYESERFLLDKFKLIDIISLTPYEPIFSKKSWLFNMGIETLRDFNCVHCNIFQIQGGVGYSFQPSSRSPFLFFALLEMDAEAGRTFKDNYRLGGGPWLGTLVDFSENWRMQLGARYKRFPLGDPSEFFQYDFKLRYSPHQDVDLRLEYMRIDHKDQGLFSINLYF